MTSPSGSRGAAVFGVLCCSDVAGPNFGPWPVSKARASTATATTTMTGTAILTVRRLSRPGAAPAGTGRWAPSRREPGMR